MNMTALCTKIISSRYIWAMIKINMNNEKSCEVGTWKS